MSQQLPTSTTDSHHDVSVRFLGVRGSLATPGINTSKVGGNTSCVELVSEGVRLVLDAGTGLRHLGDELAGSGQSETAFLLSHLHWDHIQGLPFFSPLYIPGNKLTVMSGPNGSMPLADALRKQMSAPFFPVDLAEVGSDLSIVDLETSGRFEYGPFTIEYKKLNHPDPVYGYRVECGDTTVVYATDTEHFSCVDPTLRELSRDASLLIYDAQYTPEEYAGDIGPAKVGWGHSTYTAACELARAASVEQLMLFHHDPRRSDEGVVGIEKRARELFDRSTAAREGMRLSLGNRRSHAA